MRRSSKRVENFNLEVDDDDNDFFLAPKASLIRKGRKERRLALKSKREEKVLEKRVRRLQITKKQLKRIKKQRKLMSVVSSIQNTQKSKKQHNKIKVEVSSKQSRKRKGKRKTKRKLLGLPGGGIKAEATPQVNTSRIIIHSFAAPPKADTNVIRAYDTEAHPQVIQARIRVPPRYLTNLEGVI